MENNQNKTVGLHSSADYHPALTALFKLKNEIQNLHLPEKYREVVEQRVEQIRLLLEQARP